VLDDTQLGSFDNKVFHGLDYHGKWVPNKYYKKDDVVEYKDKTYICIDRWHISTEWNPTHWEIFHVHGYDSNSSAVYDSKDFCQTDISVILETVFDQRIHLTEKILRPIACKHPFLLAAGPGSLRYLKNYGFRTFDPYINESYDNESCPDTRLKMIVSEMDRLRKLPEKQYNKILENCKEIAEYNHQLFFSKDFYLKIIEELRINVNYAAQQTGNSICWRALWQQHKNKKKYKKEKFYKDGDNHKQRVLRLSLINHLKKGGTLEDYVPPDLA
jgi:hypothetical protein